MKINAFHETKTVIQRVGGWRARRNLAQTENKTPKQNAFKPGRWVGLDPSAPGHNKTIKKRSHRQYKKRLKINFLFQNAGVYF